MTAPATGSLWREATYPEAPYDYGDVAVADFDGDGTMDMALAVHLNGGIVLVQDGKGHFRLWSEGVERRQDKDQTGVFSGREIHATDWNGDGRPDLLMLSEGPAAMPHDPEYKIRISPSGVRIYLNQGDGTWKAVGSPDGDQSFGETLVVADLDGDGIHDIVTGSRAMGYKGVVKLGNAEGGWDGGEARPSAGARPAVERGR